MKETRCLLSGCFLRVHLLESNVMFKWCLDGLNGWFCRLFGHTGACSACGQTIPPSEMVMRAQGSVYHLKVSPHLSVSASVLEEMGQLVLT